MNPVFSEKYLQQPRPLQKRNQPPSARHRRQLFSAHALKLYQKHAVNHNRNRNGGQNLHHQPQPAVRGSGRNSQADQR